MAKQNEDGSGRTQGLGYEKDDILGDFFHEMYTEKAPREYRKRPGYGDPIDPIAFQRLERMTSSTAQPRRICTILPRHTLKLGSSI